MSDYIPFDIQSKIMKCLPVKSLIQFRSVCKEWKAFIDSPDFIKKYHVNHPNPKHHLLVRYTKLDDTVRTYTSIVDDQTFPQHKFLLTYTSIVDDHTFPQHMFPLTLFPAYLVNSVNGLFCFYDFHTDPNTNTKTTRILIWNPAIRKSVDIGILVPRKDFIDDGYTVIGFGVCPHTGDPKVVKIELDRISSTWAVEVFTLSTRVWTNVYTGAPFKLCRLRCKQVFVDGVIYFQAYSYEFLDDDDDGTKIYFVISFDLKSDRFGEVCLPERLLHTHYLDVAKVNDALSLLEYYDDGAMSVCGVWMRKNGANETFSKMYTIKLEDNSFNWVVGFRNNGGVVMELAVERDESKIEVYEPLSGHITDVGINGIPGTLCTSSYTETLLLLDEVDSIIH